jgi:capsular exopolysaccharide synthesis family protein
VVLLNAELEQYQRLQSEVEALRAHYQGLDEEIRELSKVMGEDVDQMSMEILEPASPPELPSEPQKDRVLAVALLLGLLLGGGIALIRDQLDQTIRSAEEIPGLLKLPILGTVPAMSRRQKIQERGRSILLRPESPEAEAFRTVRTAVFFGAPREQARTILVTSPAPGDGKSTLVSNLAIAMARAGQKILILDADFRRPMQHTIFGVDHSQRCLRNVLAGKMTLRAAIQATDAQGPDLLTFGQGVSNPAEVLSSRQFALVLERLVGVYDRVLIDAPPVTVVTDAQIVGALSDVTVVVLKAGKSTRRASCHTVAALQGVGARVLGVVINEIRKNGDRYGYSYRQYYRHADAAPHNGKKTKTQDKADACSATRQQAG